MTLDVGYSYCINLTESEKLLIDQQVKKNRCELKLAIFVPISFMPSSSPQPIVPQPIVRHVKPQAESAVGEEGCTQYKVYNEMSSTLAKVSKRVRKDKETRKLLDKLEEQLKKGELHAGRGAKKLAGTKTVYYMRAGNKARLFFQYSDKETGAVKVIGESNKDKEQQVIDNLKQNYE